MNDMVALLFTIIAALCLLMAESD